VQSGLIDRDAVWDAISSEGPSNREAQNLTYEGEIFHG